MELQRSHLQLRCPLNMKTCKDELGVSEDVASFVLPTGVTIHMNGTTTMQIIAVTFIGTAAGIEMTPALIATAAALIAIYGRHGYARPFRQLELRLYQLLCLAQDSIHLCAMWATHLFLHLTTCPEWQLCL